MKATILSVLSCTALAFSGAAGLCAQNGLAHAKAENTPAPAELIAPSSYEQYLALTSPSFVAVTEEYTAIADGNLLYVYDRANEEYLCYSEHAKNIKSVQFDSEGNLYFLSGLYVYTLSLSALQNGAPIAQKLADVSCTGFLIQDDTLYYIHSEELCAYSLSDGTTRSLRTENEHIESPLAFTNDALYYLCENADAENPHTLYALNPQTGSVTPITDFSVQITSMVVSDNLFCFTANNGEFYAYNHTELAASEHASSLTPVTQTGGKNDKYVSLSANGGEVYAVYKNTIKQYSVENAAFTDYEISASSASAHRFNQASELCLSDNKLFIADSGNGRVSVYDTDSKAFSNPIVTELPDPYLSAYQDTLLVSSSSKATLYSLSQNGYGAPLLTLEDEVEGNIVGTASVYGRYYLLTDDNHCYALKEENGEWCVSKTEKLTQALYATAFTADVYGSLYIAYDNNAVYRFTEKELFTPEASGTKILEGVQAPEKLAVDYETAIYALQNGTITKYTLNGNGAYETNATYTPDYGLVYDTAPVLCSFAFGMDEESTYLLYDGDYLVKTDELQIPKVNPIPVGNAAERIFGEGNTEFSIVQVESDSILIEFDVTALQTATQFPYVAFERCYEPTTAVKIGEESGYSILAIPQAKAGEYKTYLAPNTVCVPIAQTEYSTAYETPLTGRITNDIPLYKFPYFDELLTVGALQRGDEVTLLGEIRGLERAYYQVLIQTDSGDKIGYIPKAYATLFDGRTPVAEQVSLGNEDPAQNELWRSAYILLGFGAICILVDFLILRKPKNEEER